jgi:Zn-dependent protease
LPAKSKQAGNPARFPFARQRIVVPLVAMNLGAIIEGLLGYLILVILLTFHEFAHAWTASKFGDDTARLQGRVSLNPLVHMDLLGTVVLPLLVIFLSAAGSGLANFIIGWGKPVPVDPRNFRARRWADTVVSVAGPAMNFALAVGVIGLAKVFAIANLELMVGVAELMAIISLLLCFFNLLPIPPLDGSHVLKNLTGMSDVTYFRLSQLGFILVILVLQIPMVRWLLNFATKFTFVALERMVGLI